MSDRGMPAPGHSTVLIGVGSPLMGDDGVGLRALETIRRTFRFEPHVELLDGGTWGMNLLPFLEGAERALILDAIDAGEPPGTLVELEGDALPRFFSRKLSPHQIDLREVLALAELRGTLPDIVAMGVQPGRIELDTELGSDVEASLPRLVEAVVRKLAAWDHHAVPAAAAAGP